MVYWKNKKQMTTAYPVPESVFNHHPEVEVFGLNLSAGGLFYQLLSVCLQTAKVLTILLILCSPLISTDNGFFYCVFNVRTQNSAGTTGMKEILSLILLRHQIIQFIASIWKTWWKMGFRQYRSRLFEQTANLMRRHQIPTNGWPRCHLTPRKMRQALW